MCIPSGAFVRFLGVDLKNHSYVNLTAVGGNHLNGSDGVECHTDLITCCSKYQGDDRGDWFSPTGKRLNFIGNHGDIFEARRARQVNLHRRNNDKPSGIYCCTIETNAVHSEDTSDTTIRETVYVGLYDIGGESGFYNFLLSYILTNYIINYYSFQVISLYHVICHTLHTPAPMM